MANKFVFDDLFNYTYQKGVIKKLCRNGLFVGNKIVLTQKKTRCILGKTFHVPHSLQSWYIKFLCDEGILERAGRKKVVVRLQR